MKKLCLFVCLLFMTSNMGASYGANTISVIINDNKVIFSNETGYPFVDENGRTQVPFRVTLEAFGAEVKWDSEKKMAYAMYNNKTVYAPIGKSYIIVDGVEQANDTAAVLKDGITYCPIRKVLEAFEFDVSWDGSTNSVIVTNQESLNQIPHPPMTLLYTATEGTGKYAGYKILHGHDLEDQYIIYFKGKIEGSYRSFAVACDLVSPKNLNEKITWRYNGQTYVNTRDELYGFFSDSVSLSSYLNNTTETFSPEWFEATYGQVYEDWLDSFSASHDATRYVEDYFDGVLKPAPIDFNIVQEDWLSLYSLKTKYNLSLVKIPNNCKLEWYNDSITDETYTYELTGYQDFSYGILEFNKIRIITDTDSNLFFYKPDIEAYVMSTINEKTADAVEFYNAWVTPEQLKKEYGVKLEEYYGYAKLIDNENRNILLKITDYENLTGEVTVQGITITKNHQNEIVFLKEGLEDTLSKLKVEVETQKKEKEAFDKKWVSSDELFDYRLCYFDERADNDDDTVFMQYSYSDKELYMKDFYKFINQGEEGDTKVFNGVEVYLSEKVSENNLERVNFNKEDLLKKGFVLKSKYE